MNRYIIPLGLFALLVIFLSIGLVLDPREVPSPLIDKPAPELQIPSLDSDTPVSINDYKGKVWLLNVWASWCVACREEHHLLVELAKNPNILIVGMNYKDTKPAASRWLQQFGNPYRLSVFDQDGKRGIDWGVYGVPETFVIDKQGIIRYKQIGPITPQAIKNTLLPLITQLSQS